MAKRSKKHGAKQKNKQGFDSASMNQEFAEEVGSHDTNQLQKSKAKKAKASKNNGKYNG
ncbi:hypothetical protein [Robertmurraya kyonggiensis]|uniref:hypothetical protein n=1 Tax=Robertmurraya kyonggiensis TaxID=1037680 RepID=UPI0014769283|nr:hypothetical protein [Robertmurraya kyonggiensis]